LIADIDEHKIRSLGLVKEARKPAGIEGTLQHGAWGELA
jgi:hypothetical protein